ncbi:hypothetical protein B296_00028820, partial [Ensete ventricosum]
PPPRRNIFHSSGIPDRLLSAVSGETSAVPTRVGTVRVGPTARGRLGAAAWSCAGEGSLFSGGIDGGRRLWFLATLVLTLTTAVAAVEEAPASRRHAYAAMMYMGTPRDYEFYVATRVMMRSLAKLNVDADLVVIASVDVPARWVQTL